MDQYVDKIKKEGYPADGFQQYCITKIQSVWRGSKAKKYYKYRRYPIYNLAAFEIQNCYLNYKNKKKQRNIHKSINTIVKAWNAYKDKRYFVYLKNLINFSNSSDTYMLLKSINPSEANLVDSSTGLFVRFRLGGFSFPPSIYYKIFTNSAVCDVNSFAPKDYTTASDIDTFGMKELRTTINIGKSAHNIKYTCKTMKEIKLYGTQRWYEREDKNGWRIINANNLNYDNPMTISAKASKTSTYDKVKRNENRLNKQNKRKWYMKMYQEGLLKESKANDSNVNFESKTWEDDCLNLLNWSKDLDYENYIEGWTKLGTSDI